MTEDQLADEIRTRAGDRARFLVAIAGAPGSGKSTLAERLSERLGAGAAVLPMDGFHLDNATLRARGLFERKGAPETFDAAGLGALLKRVKAGGAVSVPTFDRAADRVVPGGARIAETARIVLVEGNYLLLDAPGWRDLAALFDFKVLISVPEEELERRLVARWRDHGLAPDAARRRARENDLVNARLVHRGSVEPDLIFGHNN